VGRFGVLVRGSAAALFVVAQLVEATAHAQAIDPRVLQRVQGQLGAASNPSAQLDAARASDQPGGLRATFPEQLTQEEIDVRRAKSRQELRQLYDASPVEREYRARLGDPELRQFGYDIFRSGDDGTGAGPVTGEVAGNYVLGIGDELVVSFQGATNDSQTVRVDRDGRLVAGQLRPVRAAGRTLSAVRSELAAETRRTLLGTDVYVSLGSVRSATVFVGGEVERPGQYQLTSLADVATALARAGGIRRSGSLRKIRVIRANGESTVLDLYGLLGIGTPQSIRLSDGDRIIVPVIGPTAAITGTVARPGIYELKGPLSVRELVAFAGGALRSRGYEVAVSRITPDGREVFDRAKSEADAVIAGDAVQLIGSSAGGASGRVVLRGYVANRGPRSIALARTVRELVGTPEELRLGTYMPMAVLIRRDPATSARAFEPVNLITALRDAPGVALRSEDRLYIFGQSDIEFMNSGAVRQVVLGGAPAFQCLSLQYLASVVQDSQSPRLSAAIRGAFAQRRGAGGSRLTSVGGTLTQNTGQVAVGGGFAADASTVAAGTADATLGPRRTSGVNVQSGQNVLLGAGQRSLDRIDLNPECPDVFEEAPELLPLLIESSVVVGGSIRRPAAYPVAGEISAADLAAIAEGRSDPSSDLTLDISRYPGTAPLQRLAVSRDGTDLRSVMLAAGDDVRFSTPQPQFELGGVVLSGEFARPGLYSIRKGETLSQIIERAGGLTSFAYPYGAIFTRQRVREEQVVGLQRTASELNAGLLSAIARRSSSAQQGEGLVAAAALIDRITSVEPIGRMTVEADPSVLQRRRDLDTVLEAGDTVFMPKRPNFVLALGDVNNPGALQFVPGKAASAYLNEAGGLSATADDDRVFLVLPDGRAQPVKSGGWSRSGVVIPPGSTLIVPKNIDPLKTLDLARDITTIFSQVITSVASLAILATN
jgi:protein involved in polysaccharide export with SLBB domain